jgi:hypothetical protein
VDHIIDKADTVVFHVDGPSEGRNPAYERPAVEEIDVEDQPVIRRAFALGNPRGKEYSNTSEMQIAAKKKTGIKSNCFSGLRLSTGFADLRGNVG